MKKLLATMVLTVGLFVAVYAANTENYFPRILEECSTQSGYSVSELEQYYQAGQIGFREIEAGILVEISVDGGGLVQILVEDDF